MIVGQENMPASCYRESMPVVGSPCSPRACPEAGRWKRALCAWMAGRHRHVNPTVSDSISVRQGRQGVPRARIVVLLAIVLGVDHDSLYDSHILLVHSGS